MKRYLLTISAVALAGMAITAQAQDAPKLTAGIVPAADTAKITVEQKKKDSFLSTAPAIEIANYRPEDMRGINMFEAPKAEPGEYTGFKLMWGAAFTQQFQGLDHSNSAGPRLVAGVDASDLSCQCCKHVLPRAVCRVKLQGISGAARGNSGVNRDGFAHAEGGQLHFTGAL